MIKLEQFKVGFNA